MVNCNHHDHHHGHGHKVTWRLLAALGVIVTFMIVEVIGGLISGSLALLADAAHMFTDAAALGLAASAQFFAAKPADSKLHFGYRRTQVLAAFVNGILLTVLLCWIAFEAVTRFFNPTPVEANLMLGVAIAGLFANAAAFAILHRHSKDNVNVRGALLHVLSDLLGSVAAIVAALVIRSTGWMAIDPLLSIAVAVLIGVSAFRLVRETGFILLEGAPSGIDADELAEKLKASSANIKGVHNVQITQITPDQPRLTLHACVAVSDDVADALAQAKAFLEQEYNITCSTIQVEVGDCCPDISESQTILRAVEATKDTMEPSPNVAVGGGGAAALAATD